MQEHKSCNGEPEVFEIEEGMEPWDRPGFDDDGYEPCEPDNWADSDALASAGFGMDEDYGDFGTSEDY